MLPIIIAGGGIGGLTAAIAIGNLGRDVILLERAPRFEPIGYGIQIGPNALHVLERMGLVDKVMARCSIPDRGILSDALTNQCLAELPMGQSIIDRFGQPYAVIHRGDLHEVLLDACDSCANITLRNNFELVRLTQNGLGVSVQSAGGEEVRGAALIGADGIWSTIRAQVFPEAPSPFASRYAAFRCVHPVDVVEPDLVRNVVNLRCGTDFHMIHYLLRNGTLFNLVAGMKVPDHIAMDDTENVIASFESVFADGCEEIQRLLPYIDRSRYWTVSNLVPMRQWVAGRVALIGDAAHAMVQAMAQGACQAIEDGYVLSRCLASAQSIEAGLEQYQNARHTRATYAQYRSLFMWELIHAKAGWRDLRNAKLARFSGPPSFNELDWLYSAAPGSELRLLLS